MLINLKVKTLDAQTHEFSIDNEITVRDFKDKVAEKTNIAADQQRIIYCGRVMVDDKQLKDYDVDGKVVHVAERPPPSQRLATTESSGSTSNNTPNERRSRGRPGAGGMRNSPLFRALDGMVLGTMAFPVNPSTNGQAPVNPLAASSSFCMNRITVARHMLDCANNIAAFLEDPSRGLNNQSLDILARGRWTMESTVVEVGITSDIPQSQQIMEMVQGAVQAALRRNGNTNVTFMQLPTVYSSSEGEGTNAAAAAPSAPEAITDGQSPADGADGADSAASAVVIEDVIDEDDDDDTPTNEQSADNNTSTTSPPVAADTVAENATGTSSAAEEGNNDSSRRRTGTRILAAVIEQMRNVQNRLNPFIEQYYEILQSEPNFEEDDTEGRTNAQRLFDRVSEALHYMSHAQHAISDLMLDLSQPSPRFLTCRPILVEQSGYVSSNNFITPAMIPAAMRPHQQQSSRNATASATGAATNAAATTSTASSTSARNTTTSTATSTVNNANANAANDANNSTIDDPIDDPVAWPPTINFGLPSDNANNTINIGLPPSLDNTNNTATNNANNTNNATNANVARVPAQGGTLEIVLQPTRAYYLDRFQRQVARLLQDVVRAAPFDTEFHVHINSPNVVSIDVPIGGAMAAAAAAGQNRATADSDNNAAAAAAAAATTVDNNATTTASSSTSATTTNDNAATTTTSPSSSAASANGNPARVTTATLPTTSTQTRSTSRPQVHIGNIPVLGMPAGWNGRVLPNNNVPSFDRFLPCNSHHVREHENASNGVTNESEPRNTNPSNPGTAIGTARINRANIITRRPLRTMNDILNRLRRRSSRIIVGSTLMDSLRNNAAAATSRTRLDSSNTPPILRLNAMSEPPQTPRTRDDYQAFHELLERTRINYSGTTPPQATQDRRVTVHAELLDFIKTKIFEGKPINEENMPPAINRVIEWFGNSLVYLPQYEKPEYDSRHSLYNILRSTLPIVIRQLIKTPLNLNEFEQKMKEIFEQFRIRLYSVLYVCIGRANVEVYWNQLMRLLWHPIQDKFSEESVGFLTFYLSPDLPEMKDEADAQQFLVHRNAAASNASLNNDMELPPDTDVEMTEVASTSQPEVDDEPLPAVVPGSASWHRNFPNDWLPIITRDIQRQTENPPTQPPYSDAYISGMSSKRRKLIQHTKPPTEISALIADSVSKAIHNAGVGSSTSSNQSHTPDEIARVIASDATVQSSCTEAVRVNVRERLKNEPDYEPEKFPKSAKFIQK